MPVTELIATLEQKGLTVNQSHKVLKDCNVPTDGEVSDEDRDRVLAHVNRPTPTKSQPQEKGELTKAHSGLAKTAVQSTQKQMVTIADKAARAGAVAYATRSAQNLNALATEIAGLTETAMQVYDTVEGGEDEDPLALPPLSFGLT